MLFVYSAYALRLQISPVPDKATNRSLDGTTVRSVRPLQRCASRAHRGVSNAPQIYQLLRPSGTVDRNSQSRRPRSSQLPLCSRCAEALRESIQGVFSTHQARTEARVSSASNRLVATIASLSRVTVTETNRSEEHTSELQSQSNLVCRLLLEKKN